MKSYRTATYPAAMRLARIVHVLPSRPHGWTFAGIMNELRISERTLYRYKEQLKREFVDDKGRPLIEEVRRGEQRLLRMAEHGRPIDSNAYEVAFLYFALTVFDFLDGTVLKHSVEGLWDRLVRGLPQKVQARFTDFTRKFYAIQYAPKDYREFDDTLDAIVQCLIFQHRIGIQYGSMSGNSKSHTFEPYTLTMYRGGLYLIGKSDRSSKILTLAVERISSAQKLAERFDYPEGYTPEKHTEGTFGIIDGAKTEVELLILNPETVTYLSSRQLHPTQRFRKRPDGKTVLTMTVRGTTELKNWLFGLSPYVKVLRPGSLRDEIRALLDDAQRVYES